MTQHEKNIQQKIKSKLDAHEFDFNPQAWENMEQLLDGRTPNKSYFLTKIIIAMMTGLFFLWLLLWTQDAPNVAPNSSSAEQPVAPNSSSAKLTPDEKNASPANANTQNRPPETWLVQANTSLAEKTDSTPNWSSALRDTSFFEKIAARLALFNRHYAPEKVYLQFDRTFFEPGEAIWFNAWLRDANSLKASTKSELLHVELLAPNGSVLKKITLLAKGGTAAGDFLLDKTAAGGPYKIKAYTNWQRNTNDTFERDIQVQATVLPRLRMELDFLRKAYGPGDRVEAKLDLNTLANQPLAEQEFSATVSLDGQRFTEVKGKTDGSGHARIRFDLPKTLTTNDALLNVLIQYNGQTESISRSVPVVLNKIDLQFLPEGGDLVAGLPGTVAFKALNEFGKPADVEGEIFNAKGQKISTFRSYHQGMGAFDLVPEPGETYHARLTKPEGIAEKFALPEALPRGFAMRVTPPIPNSQFSIPDFIQVEISSTENEPLNVAVVSRGEIYFTQTLPAQAGSHRVKIPTATLPIGIAQVTLFDSREIPRAERLVFLNPHKKLNVSILTNKEKYLPREKVELTVKVTDERGLPMPGQFSLAVGDDNLLTFADDRQGNILAHLLLESELRGKVEEPNFYFEPKEKHPEKNQLLALDFLMMTQGWRRFGWDEILWQGPVALEFENEKAVMHGQVVDYQNQPVANLKVKIEGTNLATTTDEQGHFTLDTLFTDMRYALEMDNKTYQLTPFSKADSRQPHIRIPYRVAPQNPKPSAVILKDVSNANFATIQGRLKDDDTGEPIVFGTVAVYKNGILVTGTETDFNGFYQLTELEAGKYDLVFSYTGYNESKVEGVQLGQGGAYKLDANMTSGMELQEVVVAYTRPLIEVDNTTQGSVRNLGRDRPLASSPKQKAAPKKQAPQLEVIQSAPAMQGAALTSDEVRNLPTRDVNALASMSAGVASADDAQALNIRGSRSDATNYYVDGVRVLGGQPGGVPAQFGNQKELENAQVEEVIFRDQSIQEETKVEVSKKKSAQLPPPPPPPAATVVSNFQTIYHPRQFYSPKYDATEIQNPKSEIQRTDFRKTIFWQPNLTIGRNGTATLEFYNSDAITTFRATVEGLGMDGSIGRGEQRFFTQKPFGMDVKIPVNLLTGDRLVLPLALANNTGQTISGKLSISTPAGFSLVKQLPETLTLKAGETTTIYPEYELGNEAKTGALQVDFQAAGFSDSFAELVNVQPRGFPVAQMFGGSALEQTFNFEINDPIEGSLQAAFTVHPSVLSDLTSGLDRMLRQPSGCFEQTSSSNYPNVLVLNFLKNTGALDSPSGAGGATAIEKQANDFLDAGYKRLLTFEVPGGGFDWYGKPPAHEALTAYGLMEFVDMQRVYPVEQNLIDRTAKWLLSRRDGKGGWSNGRPGLHSWQQQSAISDAYITWAVTEAGYGQQISTEIEKVMRDAHESQDPYIMALAANILQKMNDRRAGDLLTKLAALQNADGSWAGKTHSMTHSTGQNLTVETTGLATLAYVERMSTSAQAKSEYTRLVGKAVAYLASAKSPYGFGSTQATILALKALVKHAELYRQGMNGGAVAVLVNGKQVGAKSLQDEKGGKNEPVVFANLEKHFKTGKNSVQVRFSGTDTALPYDFALAYNTRQPQSSPDCLLTLETTLTSSISSNEAQNPKSKIQNPQSKMGETLRLTTTLANRSGAPVANPIAIVGVPAGLSVQPWQVKEMQEKELFDFYEIKDGYVVFYFREMAGKEVKNIHLDLKADVPGTYEAPASSAYLYYSNDAVVWSKPERVVIEGGR